MRLLLARGAILASGICLGSFASAAELKVEAGDGAAEKLVEVLISAQPGDTVVIGAGRIELTEGLSLDVDDVTLEEDVRPRSAAAG